MMLMTRKALAADRGNVSKEQSGRNATSTHQDRLASIEHAWYQLVRASSSTAMRETILSEAGLRLDSSAYPLLSTLSELGPLRIRDLADEVHLDPSTVSRQLKSLEDAGMIIRSTDAMDTRASLIGVSKQGVKVLNRIRDTRHQMLASLLDEWTPTDLAKLEGSLTRLADNVSAYIKAK